MTERKRGDVLTAEEMQAAVDMANQLTQLSAKYDVGVTFAAMALILANNADSLDEVGHMAEFVENLARDLYSDVKAGQA